MTLAELLIAMVLAGGVALAIGHVTVQLTSGLARIDQRSQMQTEAAIALARLRTELRQATSISSLTAQAVTFTHPDVTGDSTADTITYEWSGTVGDSITRKVNSGNKEAVLSQCRALSLTSATAPIRLVASTRYPVKLEYYEKTGYAVCQLQWSAASVSKQTVPQACLFPAFVEASAAAPTSTGTGLTGQYYNSVDFTTLALTRTDSTVDKDWGTSSPGTGVNSDYFSVRWTGSVMPATTGDYTFYVTSDDGVRLWISDCLVIDNWTDHVAMENSGSSLGVSRIDIKVQAGAAGNSAQLDGAVRLLNLPRVGS